MTESSWWVGLSREDFALAVTRQAARLASAKNARLYTTNPRQFADPPRRLTHTEYTYHLEAERVEA